jgi:hypothetical protein
MWLPSDTIINRLQPNGYTREIAQMKYSRNYAAFSGLFILGSLCGCGTYVPQIQEIWDSSDVSAVPLEVKIKAQIYCEIRDAVINTKPGHPLSIRVSRDGKPIDVLPDSWGVQVTINLTVDETSALNPGLVLNTPMIGATTHFAGGTSVATPQSYNFGLGGTLSSHATRIDKFTFYYAVGDLKKEDVRDSCTKPDPQMNREGSSLLLTSDLGIGKWLHDALFVLYIDPSSTLFAADSTPKKKQNSKTDSSANSSFKPDVLSYEVKFEIISSGNVTPMWKLVRVSANTGSSPLFSANRDRTHDLTITFGPSQPAAATAKKGGKKGGTQEPTTMAANSHLASEIGLAVANSIKTLTTSP